jgi:hypothetical protein
LEKIRKLNLSDLRNVVVRCAPEEDSRDMAQRISFFFRCVDMPDDLDPKIARKRVSPVKIVEDTTLGPLTVCFGDIILTAGERMEFSGLVRRFLNVVNAVRYPKYGPSVRLEPEARPYFSFERL